MSSKKSVVVEEHFNELTDPRRREGTYPLVNIVVMALCAVICGADDFVAIANWSGETRMAVAVPGPEAASRRTIGSTRFWRVQAGRVRGVSAELDHRVARDHRRAGGRHRRQDAASQLRRGQQQVGHPHGQRLGDGEPHQPGAGRRRREEQRDHGHPQTAENAGDCRLAGDDRRDGLPDGDRCQTIIDAEADYVLAVKENQPDVAQGHLVVLPDAT